MTDDEKLQRAARARAIMEDPIMLEAKEHIDAECFRLFKSLAPTDIDQLQQVKAMQYMHDKYRIFLSSVLDDGKIAKLNLEYARARPAGY
jgi:hypothetical protein